MRYFHNLIFVQCPRSTRSSYVVALARPPTSSSLKINDRMISPFVVLRRVSGINSLYLFVSLILVLFPKFLTHLFIHPSHHILF